MSKSKFNLNKAAEKITELKIIHKYKSDTLPENDPQKIKEYNLYLQYDFILDVLIGDFNRGKYGK